LTVAAENHESGVTFGSTIGKPAGKSAGTDERYGLSGGEKVEGGQLGRVPRKCGVRT